MKAFHYEWILRILASVFFATFIGYERHRSYKEAGVRTHVLVALSTCLLMIVSKYGFPDVEKVDAARVASGVVSGITFLGAGIIFERRGKIEGLTPAAGIFATGAIGMCFGAGMYLLGVFSSLMTFLISIISPVFNYNHPRNVIELSIHMDQNGLSEKIDSCLERMHYLHTENHLRSDGGTGWYL
ncbi:MAG: MgtC/SapB family protein, partial [Erysipelotrichaceae bacterium]|nr:MgtC/SapB family protein [Erysipelotrichaceae bacterium]